MNVIGLFSRTFSPPKSFDAAIERQFLHDYSVRHATRRQVLSILALSINLAYFGIDIFNALHDSQFRSIFTEVIDSAVIFAKDFSGLLLEKSAKITRQPMPAAAPAVLLPSFYAQQGA